MPPLVFENMPNIGSGGEPTATLNCLISVGYNLELHIATTFYRHCRFLPSYIMFFYVQISCLCSLSKESHAL